MAITYTDVGGGVSLSNTSSYNFTNIPFGAADPDRVLILPINVNYGAGSRVIDSVTVGGNAATEIAQHIVQVASQTFLECAIYGIALPTGTSGPVVVTTTAQAAHCSFRVLRTVGLAGLTPFHTNSADGITPSTTLNIPSSGLAIGVAAGRSGGNFTWTGISEIYDAPQESSIFWTAAAQVFPTAQASLNVSIGRSSGTEALCLLVASLAAAPSGVTRQFMHYRRLRI